MWIKYKEENGKKVIDRASFQTFGCETAIAVASVATELIRGKTPEEAMTLSGEELAADLGPLPPMKIHCGQLVEGALRNALTPSNPVQPVAAPAQAVTLMDSFAAGNNAERKIIFLDPEKAQG
jgi:NifU-like protein involved in Fe-S cluster formation